ncbi:MAG: ribosome maturation factor RimP [Ilumatobacteraceae bacterium]|nr:ribosome maturation factor RimP [Ilumatobacteraceae bacterium]
MTDSPVLQRVRELIEPIASDLDLDLYDLEQRGGTLRVTIDTPPGSEGGVDMDKLALATRLISREMDHHDPMPGRYTLEVTSPGVERTLRTPAHFQREIGKTINVRLADTNAEQRRFEGVLVAADDTTATVRLDDADLTEQVVALADIDRARTVFVWGPQPKPGGKGAPKKKQKSTKSKSPQPSKSGAQQSSDSKKEPS